MIKSTYTIIPSGLSNRSWSMIHWRQGCSGQKLAMVVGKISSERAKITGITPGGIHLQRNVRGLSAIHLPSDDALGVLDGNLANALLDEDDTCHDRRITSQNDNQLHNVQEHLVSGIGKFMLVGIG